MEKSIHFPQAFVEQMQQLLGNESDNFFQILDSTSPVSVRLNKLKSGAIFDNAERIPWTENGYYLPERPVFTLNPLLHAGAFYVQEASSMILEYVVKQLLAERTTGVNILDLCAAPGGKSTLLASLLGENDCLVANEVIKSRVSILEENLVKWGFPNAIITNNDSEDFAALPPIFDMVVVDAPCSGEGLFRKDPKAVNEWSGEAVQMCAARQKRIVDNVRNCIKNNGFLFYSTCTYNKIENEENVQYLLDSGEFEAINFDFPKEWGIVSNDNISYHFFPHKVKGEGFFFTVFKKKNAEENERETRKYRGYKLSKEWLSALSNHIQGIEKYSYQLSNEKLYLYPAPVAFLLELLHKKLYFKHAGIELGELKGSEWIPSHEVALSTFPFHSFPTNELDKSDALKFLKKDTQLNYAFEGKGYQLVTYNGINLGWVKVIGNRINNYYPKEWRILMEIG